MNVDSNILKEVIRVATHNENISKIILFGSRARGDNHSRSDIDLAVYGTESTYLFIDEINSTVNTLLEFDITYITDQTEDDFLSQILTDGIIIYEKNNYRFRHLKKSYTQLIEVTALYDGNDDIIRDSLIKRFRMTYELTHKTLQDFFKYSGITLEVTFPRMIYKKAYSNNLIDDEKLWIKLLEDRNATSHLYSEEAANEIANRIVKDYVEAIGLLINKLDELIEIEQ